MVHEVVPLLQSVNSAFCSPLRPNIFFTHMSNQIYNWRKSQPEIIRFPLVSNSKFSFLSPLLHLDLSHPLLFCSSVTVKCFSQTMGLRRGWSAVIWMVRTAQSWWTARSSSLMASHWTWWTGWCTGLTLTWTTSKWLTMRAKTDTPSSRACWWGFKDGWIAAHAKYSKHHRNLQKDWLIALDLCRAHGPCVRLSPSLAQNIFRTRIMARFRRRFSIISCLAQSVFWFCARHSWYCCCVEETRDVAHNQLEERGCEIWDPPFMHIYWQWKQVRYQNKSIVNLGFY